MGFPCRNIDLTLARIVTADLVDRCWFLLIVDAPRSSIVIQIRCSACRMVSSVYSSTFIFHSKHTDSCSTWWRILDLMTSKIHFAAAKVDLLAHFQISVWNRCCVFRNVEPKILFSILCNIVVALRSIYCQLLQTWGSCCWLPRLIVIIIIIHLALPCAVFLRFFVCRRCSFASSSRSTICIVIISLHARIIVVRFAWRYI